MPAGKLVKVGVWEDDRFAGVIVFGLGATPNLSKAYGLTMIECCELCRVALTRHATPVSRILSIAMKFLKRQCPGLRLIVSFADSAQGHYGGIYQAGNWIFSGSVELDHWLIKGKKMHPRSVVMKYGTQARDAILQIDPTAQKIWGIKHRYLKALDDTMAKQIGSLAKPFPKRAPEAEASMRFSSTEEIGGSSPTSALHLKKKSSYGEA